MAREMAAAIGLTFKNNNESNIRNYQNNGDKVINIKIDNNVIDDEYKNNRQHTTRFITVLIENIVVGESPD
ncbi:MAG: hypothetical protein QM532_03550 [Cyanobium sp. MAG06]|nr:hypothetical protein [Cyanobium sp. MAG06]